MRFFEFAAKPPLPTFATLARYRKQLTPEARMALVAPRSTWLGPRGAMRPGAELEAGLEWLKRSSDILRAQIIVIATGAELSTGDRDRGLLADFAQRLRGTGRVLVVAPRGLWEAEHGVTFAQQTGTVYGFDPLEDDAPEGSIVYGRVQPMGARPRLTEGHLAQIAERLVKARCEQAYVSIESEEGARDARRLTKLLAEVTNQEANLQEADETEDDPEEDDEPFTDPEGDGSESSDD